jgi:hypothetical protein
VPPFTGWTADEVLPPLLLLLLHAAAASARMTAPAPNASPRRRSLDLNVRR